MVTTRSQSNTARITENEDMDRTSDNENEDSFPEVLTREQMADLDTDYLLNQPRNSERNTIYQRSYEMNRQIEELTNLVLALTQQISSNPRQGNGLNTTTTSANSRSDKRVPPFVFFDTMRLHFNQFLFHQSGK